MALLQPELADWEHPNTAARRSELVRQGWLRMAPPELDPRLPAAVVPKETWLLRRVSGGSPSQLGDKWVSCPHCPLLPRRPAVYSSSA